MNKDVFISYSRQDSEVAMQICKAFDKNAISYWIDREGVVGGQSFAERIVPAIKDSKITVFISSESSNQSPYTVKEIVIAFNNSKHIIPFRIQNISFADKLEFYLCDLNWINAYDNLQGRIDDLVTSIRRLLGNEQKKEEFRYTDIYKEIVIIPSYLNIPQRREAKAIHEKKGLKCKRLLTAPNAVAFALYANKKIDSLIVAIVILENNTIDMSILDIGDGVFYVLCMGGCIQIGNDINRITELCNKLLNDAIYNALEHPFAIDEIVLVSRDDYTLESQKAIEKVFGKPVHKMSNLSELQIKGAEIQSDILKDYITGKVLIDVVPISIGIETIGGIMTKIIESNSTIPLKKIEIFTTAFDNQSSVDIHILQGEQLSVKDNVTIDCFHFEGIPPALKGIPQIQVAFDIDACGDLKVSAIDKATGKELDKSSVRREFLGHCFPCTVSIDDEE